MPELPEVERARRALDRAASGRVLTRIRIIHPALRRQLSPARAARLAGRRVVRVERRGKHQLVHLDDGAVLHVHFRMTGDWHVGATSDEAPRHARALLELDDGTRVSLVDPRALSSITYHAPGDAVLPELGPEAGDAALNGAALGRALASRRVAVKPALLDQGVIAGLGNIYAAEALWRAKIHPATPAPELTPAQLGRLVRAIRGVLGAADELPGRYTSGDPEGRLRVYGREGEACSRCGATIERIRQAGRSTYFCPGCQR
jgi:formamidopyrimidine-DNA glycosylase